MGITKKDCVGTHCFSVKVAEVLGIEKAVILHHIVYWIKKNEDDGRNIHDGKHWIRLTAKEIATALPYLAAKSVGRWLAELVKDKYLLATDKFNKSRYDRTMWYAFVGEEYALAWGDDKIEYASRSPSRTENVKPKLRVRRERPLQKSRIGHVYLILDNERGWHKIGISAKVHKRLGAYDDITIVGLFKSADMRKDEKELHRVFSGKRVSGEWFDLDGKDIEQIQAYQFTSIPAGTEA